LIACTQGKLPQRASALPRLPPVTVEEWERFRDDWGRIDTDSELKFKARVFYGVKNIVTIVLFCALKLYLHTIVSCKTRKSLFDRRLNTTKSVYTLDTTHVFTCTVYVIVCLSLVPTLVITESADSISGDGPATLIILIQCHVHCIVQIRGGWSPFSRNVHKIIAYHMQCIIFADSVG
jgi:hypothetical protein